MLGQTLVNQTIGSTRANIDMSQLTPGAYIMWVKIGENMGTFKLIKQ